MGAERGDLGTRRLGSGWFPEPARIANGGPLRADGKEKPELCEVGGRAGKGIPELCEMLPGLGKEKPELCEVGERAGKEIGELCERGTPSGKKKLDL